MLWSSMPYISRHFISNSLAPEEHRASVANLDRKTSALQAPSVQIDDMMPRFLSCEGGIGGVEREMGTATRWREGAICETKTMHPKMHESMRSEQNIKGFKSEVKKTIAGWFQHASIAQKWPDRWGMIRWDKILWCCRCYGTRWNEIDEMSLEWIRFWLIWQIYCMVFEIVYSQLSDAFFPRKQELYKTLGSLKKQILRQMETSRFCRFLTFLLEGESFVWGWKASSRLS